MVAKELKPRLRFSGFTDAWEKRQLGEVASFTKGRGYTKKDLVPEGCPIILYGRLYTNYETIISTVDTYVESSGNSIISEGGEVIVPSSGESPEDIAIASVVLTSGIILGGDLNIVKPNQQINSVFLAITISSGSAKNELSKRAQGKSVVHLHNSDLQSATILFPTHPEQTAIGNFFSQLDRAIALQERKCQTMKNLKKTLLKKMFPENDASKPALRFAGFTDDWEKRQLGEEVSFFNGRAYKQSELLDEGKYRVVRVGNFNTNSKWYYSDLELEDNKFIDTDDLIYLWATSFGPEIWTAEKAIYHYHIWKLKIKDDDKIDKKYLYVWLLQDKDRISQNTNGSTMVHITKTMIEERWFDFPTLPEQTAIGTFFSQLDLAIALQEWQVKKHKPPPKSQQG